MNKHFIVSAIVSLVVVACAAEEDGFTRRNSPGDGTGADEGDPTQPGSCKVGEPHIGFANTNFVEERKEGGIGAERRRIKPHSALKSEFERALGKVPDKLASSSAAYGQIPARWYQEPQAGAVSLYTTYSLGFTTCYDTMTGANFQAAPTAETAADECSKMQRKFWQRTPSTEEITACADLIVGLTSEANPRRRWAHGCASILTAAGFTTY